MRPARATAVKARILPDGCVVLHSPSTDIVHTLTPLGGLIWEFCDGQNTFEQIENLVSALIAATAPPVALQQVDELVHQLADLGLIQLRE